VRVISADGQQLGVFALAEAINMARARGVDLVEIAATATPPVCRLVDYGKYRYEQAKKVKEARKHQHANKVKEIQLSPQIDPHDFGVKLGHAVDFLCEEMKVKVTLRFRGREMAHKEFGFQQIEKFTREVSPYGHPDAPPKLVGKGISVMFSPLPRNKRARNPRQDADSSLAPQQGPSPGEATPLGASVPEAKLPAPKQNAVAPPKKGAAAFSHNPFAKLELNPRPESPASPTGES
jgi:translation initiation factor IF-3